MLRDYPIVSPSLDGVLTHEGLLYEGIRRPSEVMRVFDSPATGIKSEIQPYQQKLLEQYFYDLYGVFMKKLSSFVLGANPVSAESVKLQAMLQEMIKVKRLLAK